MGKISFGEYPTERIFMDKLSLVAAIGRSNELGLNNRLIWKIKEDLMFYKKLTINQNIIMGRKTFESLPMAALKGRNPFILSSTYLDKHYDVNSFNSIETLLQYIDNTNQNFIVIGGSTIYNEFLPYVDTMYLTEIDENSNADTFFPYIDFSEWNIETIYSHSRDYTNPNDISYVRNKYIRKKVK